MKNINYIIGNENIIKTPLKPFCDDVCNFLNDLSQALLKSPTIREYGDLSALGFFTRKANIQKIKEENKIKNDRLGRGLCFHIAPSNIPINSIFSYVFGLLAGNANIVRLSSKNFPQVDFLCNLIKDILEKYPEIKKRSAIVKYERDDEISEMFSKISDCRMIWGGDKTISIFKSYQTKPRCIDITFPDRYSILILDGKKLAELEEEKFDRLIQNFYIDTYLMDQNACSTPQLIYWLNEDQTIKDKFWQKVFKYSKNKYSLQDEIVVDKYTKLCEDAIDNNNIIKDVKRIENLLYISELGSINKDVEKLRGKGGYFYEYSLNSLDELVNIITEKYQTITYFGINPEELRTKIIEKNVVGVDRIVPIGKSMDINTNWDGFNLIKELSRKITIE